MINSQLSFVSLKLELNLTVWLTCYSISNVVFAALAAEGPRIVKAVSNSMTVVS